MNAGTRVRIIKYPHLTGTLACSPYKRTFEAGAFWNNTFTPDEPRVDINWDREHGTPERTTIIAELIEVIQ